MSSLQLGNIFQSDMVIQQQKPVLLWGSAIAQKEISVVVGWTSKCFNTTVDSAGYWEISIGVPKVAPGDLRHYNIVASDGTDEIMLTNVLIGEVWVATGQSNMQYRMNCEEGKINGVINYKKEISLADYPKIRLFYVGLSFKHQPGDEILGQWQICSPETIKDFSGVAYYFARELHLSLNIPIGIILSNIGASLSESWASRTVLETDEILYKRYLKSYDSGIHPHKKLDDSFDFEKVRRPTLLYNAMIHPLRSFKIKGVIWYTGELNRSDRQKYTRLLTHLITGWRKDFNQGDFPFYIVQHPPYFWDNNDPEPYDYAIFRETQASARRLKNVEIAVTIDDDEPLKLHPKNKRLVGTRLAFIALNKDYNIKSIAYLGPQHRRVTFYDHGATITYSRKTTRSGLRTTDGLMPRHFFLAGPDRIFFEAEARIRGNTILLSCDNVKAPIAVRYAFTNMAVANLVNSAGLPAEPFRTDLWEPPKIITVLNNKGGAGKSTLALSLAAYYSESATVLLVDMDLQGGLFNLKEHHPALNIVNVINLAGIQKMPYDIIIVDTPSKPFSVHQILMITTFALIPTKASFFDIVTIPTVLAQIATASSRHTLKYAIVFNMVKPLDYDLRQYTNHVRSMQANLLETVVADHRSVQQVALSAGILRNNTKAKKQIADLAGEILSLI